MTVLSLLLIIWGHFVSDFLMQREKRGINKSKSNTSHILYYSCTLFLFALMLFNLNIILAFVWVLFNGISHYYVDYFTSRLSSKMYVEGKFGTDSLPNIGFFSVIGFDQALHMSLLMLSYFIMV